MKFTNPMAASDLDMQDTRGEHYALQNPVRNILRWEGLIYFVFALVLYNHLDFSWKLFIYWFFLPDIALLPYIFGQQRIGLLAYNFTHSSVGAGVIAIIGILYSNPLVWQISLIWFAHIGFDRLLGYGLKFPLGFRVTHLGLLRGQKSKNDL